MTARSRTYTLPRYKQWQYELKAWLPISLFLLFLVSIVVCVCYIAPSREAVDVRGAVTRHGSGVVTSFTYGFVDQSGYRSPDQVNIALNGTEATYKGTKFLLLHKGQGVEVTYRVGKSGNIYVSDITPERKAKP